MKPKELAEIFQTASRYWYEFDDEKYRRCRELVELLDIHGE